jgi:hypothetical protein
VGRAGAGTGRHAAPRLGARRAHRRAPHRRDAPGDPGEHRRRDPELQPERLERARQRVRFVQTRLARFRFEGHVTRKASRNAFRKALVHSAHDVDAVADGADGAAGAVRHRRGDGVLEVARGGERGERAGVQRRDLREPRAEVGAEPLGQRRGRGVRRRRTGGARHPRREVRLKRVRQRRAPVR